MVAGEGMMGGIDDWQTESLTIEAARSRAFFNRQ
jgi:hypothetical protein